jgi:uncharacterized protein YhhL (DUF1145 family)
MKFDLRFPIGLLFSFYGVLLVIFGLCSDPANYDRSLHININLWWGIVLLVFGLGMLMLALRARARKP